MWCPRRASRLSCSTVRQLLALNRPQLDALFDQLRPLPGHRVLLQKFLADQRMEAMKAAADRETGAAPADSSDAVATPAQRREWSSVRRSLLDASVAAKRGRDGPIAHLIEQQPLHWGTAKGPTPLAQVSGHAMIAALQPCRRRHTVDGRLSHCVSPSDLLSTIAPLALASAGLRLPNARAQGGQQSHDGLRRAEPQLAREAHRSGWPHAEQQLRPGCLLRSDIMS